MHFQPFGDNWHIYERLDVGVSHVKLKEQMESLFNANFREFPVHVPCYIPEANVKLEGKECIGLIDKTTVIPLEADLVESVIVFRVMEKVFEYAKKCEPVKIGLRKQKKSTYSTLHL